MEDSRRESLMLCKSLGWLSVIIRLTIAAIGGEDFPVACVGSRFNVAPTETSSNPKLGSEKHKNRRAPRQLACFHPATIILSIAVSPHIAVNEMYVHV